MVADVRALFEPAGVAVVGASPTNPSTRAAVANFAALGYAGRVAGVNPRYRDVLGVPCAPSLAELDFVPDAVLVAVGRDRVLPAVAEAVDVGARAAVVFGLGFADTGAEGAALQGELVDVARRGGMALLGPNCQGLINFARATPLYLDDVRAYAAGAAGLIAQSGSMATALINNRRGVRWRYAVSSGNEAVVDAADLLAYMVDDEDCRVVCLFLESIRDPDRFFAACDRALERDLPVVVLKTGKTPASMRAAEAHSGALAVPDRLVDARFERHGVIRVQSLDELLETANALQARRVPPRGAIATVAASGGQIEVVLDSAGAVGLEHAELSAETTAQMAALLPDFLHAANPLDYYGVADEDAAYPALVTLLADDPNVDIVIAAIDQTVEPTGDGRYQNRLETAQALAGSHAALFVALEGVGGVSPPERVEATAATGALLLSGFDTGMRALAHLVEHSRRVARRRAAVRPPVAAEPLPTRATFSGSGALDYLAAHGVPVVPTRRVSGADAAVQAAAELGYPLVAKLDDVAHKTEVGGVVVGIEGEPSLRRAIERLGDDVILQPQLSGVELLVGITRHPALGSFIVAGLGGIWTELLDEVTIVPVGLAEGEAERLLAGLRGHELLAGARGSTAVDRAALVAVIETLDAVAVALGDELASIDLNPVIATGDGAFAVDAVIVPAAGRLTPVV
ncbi:MAG TPA: acetate--CoA ligase family protein [Solirubrobacteraceae bacterium]|nr:acetate--CoA ligase family protein [Solirubrobacteraceae bacterium]